MVEPRYFYIGVLCIIFFRIFNSQDSSLAQLTSDLFRGFLLPTIGLTEISYPIAHIAQLPYLYPMRLLPILAILFLTSCGVSKKINKARSTTDSSTVEKVDYKEQFDLLQNAYKETVEMYESMIADSSGVTIIYEQLPGDTIVRTVTIDNGRIEASGALKSVQVSNTRLQSTVSRQSQTIDSLTRLVSSKDSLLNRQTDVRTETVTVERIKESWYIPWWVYVIGGLLVIGIIFKKQIPFIKHLNI